MPENDNNSTQFTAPVVVISFKPDTKAMDEAIDKWEQRVIAIGEKLGKGMKPGSEEERAKQQSFVITPGENGKPGEAASFNPVVAEAVGERMNPVVRAIEELGRIVEDAIERIEQERR